MYVHWMVTNIPGNNIKDGVEVMQYLTPFSLEFTEAGEFITDEAESSHPLIVAVFKQRAGRIVVDEAQKGCTKVSDNEHFKINNGHCLYLFIRTLDRMGPGSWTTGTSGPSMGWSWFLGPGC